MELQIEKRWVRVGDVVTVTSLGKSQAYDLVKRGVIASVRVDGAIRVPVEALDRFCKEREAAGINTQ